MIEITLPWPDKRLSPNSRCHWLEKAEAAKDARNEGIVLAHYERSDKRLSRLSGYYEMLLIFNPPDRRKRDLDNFHSRLKNYIDGICEGYQFDDSHIKRTILEWGEVVRGGKVVLRLEEMK